MLKQNRSDRLIAYKRIYSIKNIIMNLDNMNQHQGVCCPEHLLHQQHVDEKLTCVICYQVMTKPVMLKCGNNHTFGMSCIKEWLYDKCNKTCPYCRKPVTDWEINAHIQKQVNKLKGACQYCKSWEGKIDRLFPHQIQQDRLQETVSEQIKEIDLEINPHLKAEHGEIYEKYVQDWKWLLSDTRNWKWWWWAHNSWWNNEPCKQCNRLWHKHEKTIDKFQERRINLIETMNKYFALNMVRDIFNEDL